MLRTETAEGGGMSEVRIRGVEAEKFTPRVEPALLGSLWRGKQRALNEIKSLETSKVTTVCKSE